MRKLNSHFKHSIDLNAYVFFSIGLGDPTEWKEVLDVNVYGLSLCTRHGVQNMLKHKIDDGHIININRLAENEIF